MEDNEIMTVNEEANGSEPASFGEMVANQGIGFAVGCAAGYAAGRLIPKRNKEKTQKQPSSAAVAFEAFKADRTAKKEAKKQKT